MCVSGGGRLNQWFKQRDGRCDTEQQMENVPDKPDLTDVQGLECAGPSQGLSVTTCSSRAWLLNQQWCCIGQYKTVQLGQMQLPSHVTFLM